MNNLKYIVKPEDRKVICIYYCGQKDVIDYIYNQVAAVLMDNESYNKYMLKSYYIGIATCAPEDEWNEEIGKLVALRKAKKKYYSAFFKRLNAYIRKIDNLLDAATGRCNTLGEKWQKNIDRLDDKIEEKLKK